MWAGPGPCACPFGACKENLPPQGLALYLDGPGAWACGCGLILETVHSKCFKSAPGAIGSQGTRTGLARTGAHWRAHPLALRKMRWSARAFFFL